MLRTNFFQRSADGAPKPWLSFKLEPARLPWLPLPRPRFEIFVYSPRVEGVHLRGGKVARGGIRWSDRREDFRTEVLGLMKAQMVKNAVIVPVGAKGGFVVKRPPAARRSRGAARGGRGLLSDLHQRPARCDRQHRRRRDRRRRPTSCATTTTTPTWSSPPTRARRPSRTSPTRSRATTGSGWATRSPRAGRADTTTRRWASPRAERGSRSSVTSASSAATSRPRTSPSPASATCRATCSATACCCPRTSTSWAPSTTVTCSSTRTPWPKRASRSAGACSRSSDRRGATTTAT